MVITWVCGCGGGSGNSGLFALLRRWGMQKSVLTTPSSASPHLEDVPGFLEESS